MWIAAVMSFISKSTGRCRLRLLVYNNWAARSRACSFGRLGLTSSRVV